jgi:hypothetical protein
MHARPIPASSVPVDEDLADDLLAKVAAARGLSSKDLLSRLTTAASLDSRTACLQPHEIDGVSDLSEERGEHVRNCLFCQGLLEGIAADEEDAAAFASQAVITASRALFVRTILDVVRVPPNWVRHKISGWLGRSSVRNGTARVH